MTVTVGIPFYDAAQTISLAARSVFAQTFEDWELLLVDDGSTDGSLKIASSIRDPRVTVVSDGVNRGLQYRLNQIAQLANRQYLARMDADDIMHPERLMRQVHVLDDDPSVDAVGTAAYTIDGANDPIGLRGNAPLDSRPRSILRSGLFIHPSVTGRTRWFRDNPYDESFVRAEDHELWCRTCTDCSFAKLQSPLHYLRENARSQSDYLNDCLKSCRTDRRIIALYGPSTVGRPTTLLLLLQSYLKGQTYCVATLLGAQAALVRRRNHQLVDSRRKAALHGLDVVANTHVPGLAPGVRG